jgi:hypothetical protein
MGITDAIGRIVRPSEETNGAAPDVAVDAGAHANVHVLPDPAPVEPEPVSTAIGTQVRGPKAPGFDELEATATIVEAMGLGFHLGSAIERIALSETDEERGATRLREAVWLIERHMELTGDAETDALALEAVKVRLDRNGRIIDGLRSLSATVDALRAGELAHPVVLDDAKALPAVEVETGNGSARTDPVEEDYPLSRELVVMAVRSGLILLVLVIVVLVATLASNWH